MTMERCVELNASRHRTIIAQSQADKKENGGKAIFSRGHVIIRGANACNHNVLAKWSRAAARVRPRQAVPGK